MDYRFEEKEVYFDQYCKTCKYWDCPEICDACAECLEESVNWFSHKPVGWVQKEGGE